MLFVCFCVFVFVCLCLCGCVCVVVFVFVSLHFCVTMFVCLCFCVFVFVCLCSCVFVFLCLCISDFVFVYLWFCVCAFVSLCVFVCVFVCLCVCVYVCLCVCLCSFVGLCFCVCVFTFLLDRRSRSETVWDCRKVALFATPHQTKQDIHLEVWNFLEADSKKYDIQNIKYFYSKILNQYRFIFSWFTRSLFQQLTGERSELPPAALPFQSKRLSMLSHLNVVCTAPKDSNCRHSILDAPSATAMFEKEGTRANHDLNCSRHSMETKPLMKRVEYSVSPAPLIIAIRADSLSMYHTVWVFAR